MDLKGLDAGARIELDDLSIVEVIDPSQDGETIRIRYVEAPFDRQLIGTEATVDWDSVTGVVDGGDITTDLRGESRARDWVG